MQLRTPFTYIPWLIFFIFQLLDLVPSSSTARVLIFRIFWLFIPPRVSGARVPPLRRSGSRRPQVRGLCDDLSNVDTLFESVRVYGDMKNSDIYGMWYGHYSYGHLGGVWTNNLMHGEPRTQTRGGPLGGCDGRHVFGEIGGCLLFCCSE